MSLPSSKQTWAHSTVSKHLLNRALEDSSITAIETDILLGYDTTTKSRTNPDSVEGSPLAAVQHSHIDENDVVKPMIPIMAHPPHDESDLSVRFFLERIRRTKHHIKLDFKQQAVVIPTLKLLNEMLSSQEHENDHYICSSELNSQWSNNKHRTFFLNADILPGPGKTEDDLTVHAKPFLDACEQELFRHHHNNSRKAKNYISTSLPHRFALSLGWRVDVCCPSGYLADHVEQMNHILKYIEIPVVLAVNARLLAKSDPEPFLRFLSSASPRTGDAGHCGDGKEEASNAPYSSHHQGQHQLLVWTGAGEPPIGPYTLLKLQKMFDKFSDQVGYDVQMTNNSLEAAAYDTIMWLLGWKNKLIRKWKQAIVAARSALFCWTQRSISTRTKVA